MFGVERLNDDATWAEVVAVGVEARPLTAYNLTVADFHTYFVAANTNAAPVWVHNADCFDIRKRYDALGVKERQYHPIKRVIKRQFLSELTEVGVDNPDIGFDSTGNLIFRNPVTKKVVLRTNIPISSYGE